MKKAWLRKALLFSRQVVSDSFVTPWTTAHQAPLSMGFLRQEYWSGLPFPSLGGLPKVGIKPASPALAGTFFTTESLGKPQGKNSKRQKCKPLWVLSHTLAFILIHLGVSQKPTHL